MPARPRALKRVCNDARVAAAVQAFATLKRTQGTCRLDGRAADQRVLEPPLQEDALRVARRRCAHDLNTWTLAPEADFSCKAPSQTLPSHL